MIVVTGATGQLGRGVVERLLERVPADQVGVSVRDPEKARDLGERGIRVRHAAGTERIVYTSHMGTSPASAFGPMLDHAATEAALQASGVAFSSLRNGFYASSAVMLMGAARDTGELVAPEDGPVSWTTHADLAEAAAIALTGDDRLDGLTAPLTGSEALDLADLAALASEIDGRPIKRVTVSDEDFRAGMVARGVPAQQADLLLGLFVASRQGEFAAVDPTLAELLGRTPISMRDVLTTV